MDYQPKLLHASLTTFIAIGLIAWSDGKEGNVFTALIIGAFVFIGMTVVIVQMIMYSNLWDTKGRYIESYIKMNPEQRSELGFRLPSLGLHVNRGQVELLFDDTYATAEHIRLFLVDSTPEHTASERDWNTEERPRWAWKAIYDWLVRNGKVYRDSASGSHSFKWIGNSYRSMMFYFLRSPVPDLNAVEGLGAPRVYASEVPSPSDSNPLREVFQGSTHSRGGENRQNRGSGGV